ncbi:MAG: hypothetical protein H0W68_12105 [Gemmatimonadaceae bacterium]|nr:hypothetical protein [Gemmatimonadaceae bacterium]
MEGTQPIELRRIPDPYRNWNRVLLDELFPVGRFGTQVYLSIHGGLLDDLGTRQGLGDRSGFVRAVLELSPPGRFFAELSFLWEIWDDTRRGPPPFVAGLALAVLAAGDMETDESATQANYYVRLNTLLGTPGRDRPDRFESTVDLWRSLRTWLSKTRRGELMVRGLEGARPYVEAVSSQSLVRSCDLPALVNAVTTFSGAVATTIEPEDAAPALARWLATSGSRSRLARILGPRPERPALLQAAEALCDQLQYWSPPSTAGSRTPPPIAERTEKAARAVLAVRPNRYPNLMWRRAEWLLRVPAASDAEEPELLVQVGDRVLVALLDMREPATYDVVIAASEAAAILRGQLRVLDDAGVEITPHAANVLWLADGAVRGRQGAWVIVNALEAGTPYAAAATNAQALADIQHRAVDRGIALLPADSWPGGGLFGASAISFNSGAELPGGVSIGEASQVLRLTGGLLLRRRVYLRGALPQLLVPDEAMVEVTPADAPAVQTTAHSFPSFNLSEGAYRIESCGHSVELIVTEPLWHECRASAAVEVDPDIARCTPTARVRGALLEVREERHASHVRPGLTYRLYTNSMLKGDSGRENGLQEIITRAPQRNIVIIRSSSPAPPLPRAPCVNPAENSDIPDVTNTDRLLEFISARGEGSVELLRGYCGGIAAGSWHGVLTTLEDLGHVEVCWSSRRWFAAAAATIPRESDPSVSVFVGLRAHNTMNELRALNVRAHLVHPAASEARAATPGAILAPTVDVIRAAPELERRGVRVFEHSTASAIATHALAITDSSWWAGQEFTPSSRVRRTLERWNPERLQWSAHPEASPIDGPALYRWREHGIRMHYFASRSLSCSVRDFAAVKWNLAPRDASYLAYESRAQRLLVPVALGLPRVLRRACSTALGLPPQQRGRVHVYEGIPLHLAQLVAVRLNQTKAEGLW